jgi:small multidrug resistance family-3 protein
MIKAIQHIHPVFFLLVATILEVSGDAIIRTSMYHHTGLARIGLMVIGALLLFGYGYVLNLTPVEFGQVVGLYIATLFLVWQVGNYIAFKTLPTLPIVVGGVLVIAGGLIITFWKPQ